jgi:hypothetical protein
MQHRIVKRGKAFSLTAVLACGALVFSLGGTGMAYADNTEIEELLTETGERLEQPAKENDEDAEKVKAHHTQDEENRLKIEVLEHDIPVQEEKGAVAMVALYKMQQEGFSLINMILDASSLDEFISSIEYLNTVHQINMNEVVRLRVMKTELQETRDALQENKKAADAEMLRAEEALEEAKAAREEAQRKAEEEAARIEAARLAELAWQEQQANGGTGDGSPHMSGPSSLSGIDWTLDRDTFVSLWAGRIDAYLAGSPLTGQGYTFAEAAWRYGVDPRFSPAISCIESSKGRYCFLQHNAWGWGNISWPNWETAIDTHVRGLANGYGGTVSVWGAQKYCPPNWQHWYNTTLSEMGRI